MEQVFQATQMSAMVISALVTIIGPIVLIVLWRKKYHMRLTAVWVGACAFITFARLLEGIVHQAVLGIESPVQQFFTSNNVAFVIYVALAAGIFEETGRLVAYKFVLKGYKRKEHAIAYGIGHGGIECIMVGGFSMINNLLLAVSVNAVGLQQYYNVLPAENLAESKLAIETLVNSSSLIYLLGGFERVIAVVLQIALSIIVFYAVKRSGRLYLYGVAIGLHAFVDMFAALYQVGVITNIWLLEGILLVLTIAIAYFAYTLYKADQDEERGTEDAIVEPRGPIFVRGKQQTPTRSMRDVINDVNRKDKE